MGENILIVDDDKEVLAMLEDVLLFSHFNVKGIRQAGNIFKVIDEYKPDLILMDYILNGINGGELCHHIKTNSQTSHLPVVLISAYPGVSESMRRYRCDAFIAKPFDISDLIYCVNDCLHRVEH
jgi:DNA-binding response OmpR family regulator